MDKLSSKTLQDLYKVLNNIENELGNLCEIKIHQLNKCYDNDSCYNNTCMICIGESPISIEIYDVIDGYEGLAGNYDYGYSSFSVKNLEKLLHKKYIEERFSGIHTCVAKNGYFHTAGICRTCNNWKSSIHYTYNFDFIVNNPDITYGSAYIKCQACDQSWENYKYYSLTVNYNNSLIYDSKQQIIAKFRLLRNNMENPPILPNNISCNKSCDTIPLNIII